jgi:hypothetical protein
VRTPDAVRSKPGFAAQYVAIADTLRDFRRNRINLAAMEILL